MTQPVRKTQARRRTMRRHRLVLLVCWLLLYGIHPDLMADILTRDRDHPQADQSTSRPPVEMPETVRPSPDPERPVRRSPEVQRPPGQGCPTVLVHNEEDQEGTRTVWSALTRALTRHGFCVIADRRGPRSRRGVEVDVYSHSTVAVFPEKRFKMFNGATLGGYEATVNVEAHLTHSTSILTDYAQAGDPLNRDTALARAAESAAAQLSEQLWMTFDPRPVCGTLPGANKGTAASHQNRALIIPISAYPTSPLPSARPEAERVAARLEQMGFDLMTLDDHEATRAGILRAFEALAKDSHNTDQVFILYIGHADTETLLDGTKAGYIIPVDGHPGEASTGISMELLRHRANRLCAQRVFFMMSACFSGLLTGPYRHPGVYMLTAGKEGETIRDGDGFLIDAFLRALAGDANRNHDASITASELRAYIPDRVVVASRGRQSPQFQGYPWGDPQAEFAFPALP